MSTGTRAERLRLESVSPDQLLRFGVAMLFALAVAFAIHVLTADGVASIAGGRLGGDWAPFRTAGELVRRDPALVLDAAAQRDAMAEYFDGGFLVFPYPPIVAYLFVPAAWVSFTTGYIIWVALLAAVAVQATRWTLDVLDVRNPQWRRVAVIGVLTFAPVFRATTGAQNSAVTLLLLAGGVLFVVRERPWAGGVVLGLLWYKPQFAVPLLGLLVALRHWRTAAAVAATGVAFWGVNAAVWGPGWVSEWWTGVVAVVDQGNIEFSTNITVSIVEWVRWAAADSAGPALSLLVAALVGLGFVAVGWRHRDTTLLLPLASAALLVTAPHALIYELTLLVPVIGSALTTRGRRGLEVAVGVWGLAALVVLVRHPLARIPFVLLVVAWWLVELDRADEGAGTRLQSSHTV